MLLKLIITGNKYKLSLIWKIPENKKDTFSLTLTFTNDFLE